MSKMKFKGHETFFIRKGWLNKGMRNVVKDPYVFMGVNGNPTDILGIGTNMVKSLRYWLQANLSYVREAARTPQQEYGICRSEEHTSELQSHHALVCRLLLEKMTMYDY